MANRWDKMPIEQRFWEKVDKQGPVPEHMPDAGPCWIWTAAKNENGYGVMNRGDNRLIKAHRMSMRIDLGRTLAPSEKVRHACDNPPCVNPAHLSVGSQLENIHDAVSRGRHKHGDIGAEKLSSQDVEQIRIESSAGRSNTDIAERFGVTQPMVSMIVNGKRWASAAGPLKIKNKRKAA